MLKIQSSILARPFRRVRSRCAFALIASLGLLVSPTISDASDWPKFRKGVWQFERTLFASGSGGTIFRRKMTRCVDPSESMKETFRASSVGTCRSSRPDKVGSDKYVFAQRCDYMGPVRTTIVVESDTAYTEVNELQVGALPRTDTVVARRIAECT
jgi:hypothetical protein